jgi:polysaccharide biosynthesis transport protein
MTPTYRPAPPRPAPQRTAPPPAYRLAAPRVIQTPPPPRPMPMPRAAAKPKSLPVAAPVWHGPPILAQIGDGAILKAGDYVLDYPRSAYAHHMAALARQLESNNGAAIVVVTAAEAGENKSAVGVSLVRAAALQGKKALLIDCDPAQSATRSMGAAPKQGLYDVLIGAVPLNQSFAKDPRSEAFVLAMTKRPPSLATMFASNQMIKLIGILRNGCDMVVIDCAKVGGGEEASLLARLADATLLVSRHSALYAPSLAKSVASLNSAQAAPIGIVVTR